MRTGPYGERQGAQTGQKVEYGADCEEVGEADPARALVSTLERAGLVVVADGPRRLVVRLDTEAVYDTVRDALTQLQSASGDKLTDPVHGYLAPVIAYMTAVGMSSRPRWRVALWIVVILSGTTELISGYTTPLSLLLTVLIGWSVAYGTLYAIGSPNIRPTGKTLMIDGEAILRAADAAGICIVGRSPKRG